MKNLKLKRSTSILLTLAIPFVFAVSFANNGTNSPSNDVISNNTEKELPKEDDSNTESNEDGTCENNAMAAKTACQAKAYSRSSLALCTTIYKAAIEKCN